MPEPTDPLKVLRERPFRVAALERVITTGSYERSLLDSVVVAVRADVDYVLQSLEPIARMRDDG